MNFSRTLFISCLTAGLSYTTTLHAQNGDKGKKQIDPIPAKDIPPSPFLTPEKGLASLQLADGFSVGLFAAEPMVQRPVAIQFDLQGRCWVVEMRDYMTDLDGTEENAKTGRIRVLEDTNGDGKADKATTVLDNLQNPRLATPCHGGVLYTSKSTLYHVALGKDLKPTGSPTVVDAKYATGGNLEHRSNGMMRSLDNWFYNAKCDKRYRQLDGKWIIEKTKFRGQWGIDEDEYGKLVANNNSSYAIVDSHFPNLFYHHPKHKPTAPKAQKHLRGKRIFPARMNPGINRAYQGNLLDKDGRLIQPTGACSPIFFKSDSFGKDFSNASLICEPCGNLVIALKNKGTSGNYSSSNMYQGKAFLASTDERFRPVAAALSTDGSLYIADMYHGIVQHKTYMTTYLRKQHITRGLQNPGKGTGRIYRITKNGQNHKSVKLDNLTALLSSNNGTVRKNAQFYIIDNNKKDCIPELHKIAQANDSNPLAKLHALYTLQGLGELTAKDIPSLAAMNSPQLLEHAIYLLGQQPQLLNAKTKAELTDIKAPAHFTAFALARSGETAHLTALSSLVKKNKNNKTLADAVLSGSLGNEIKIAQALKDASPDLAKRLTSLVSTSIAALDPTAHLTKEQKAQHKRGAALYQTYCMACHAKEGEGMAQMGPPLASSQWVTSSPKTLAAIMLKGLSGPIHVNGKKYALQMQMPPLDQNKAVTDATLADISTYIRNSWGNKASTVSPAQIKAVRELTKKDSSFTVETLTKKFPLIERGETINLFNGKDLSNWEIKGGNGKYKIEDGAIVGFGEKINANTFLCTKEKYTNFELTFEFKFDHRIGNSGVMFRANTKAITKGNKTSYRVFGYQCEGDNTDRSWTAGLYDEARRGWLFPMKTKEQAEKRKFFTEQGRRLFKWKEWNTITIRCYGNHIQTWLNGEKRVDFIDKDKANDTRKGFIGLQVHGGTSFAARWKNIKLTPLK